MKPMEMLVSPNMIEVYINYEFNYKLSIICTICIYNNYITNINTVFLTIDTCTLEIWHCAQITKLFIAKLS